MLSSNMKILKYIPYISRQFIKVLNSVILLFFIKLREDKTAITNFCYKILYFKTVSKMKARL